MTAVHDVGAGLILLTPPPYAGRVNPRDLPREGESFGYKTPVSDYNEVLAEYGKWIRSQNKIGGVAAFTNRSALERFMEQVYKRNPFTPVRSDTSSWQTLIGLVRDQRLNYDFYLLNSIGHGNPGVFKKEILSKEDAERANETLKMRILKHLNVNKHLSVSDIDPWQSPPHDSCL